MATRLAFEAHLNAIEVAAARIAEVARRTPLDAPVPTCPDWDLRALVAHQAMVHRWATTHIEGRPESEAPDDIAIGARDDLVDYFDEGAALLLGALRAAPADLEAMTFLNDAPPPRDFWGRRQAHETTIHAVDAVAAGLGRYPTADELQIDTALAVDGIDELLRGFFTRFGAKMYDGTGRTVLVAPTDADRRWVVRIEEKLAVDDHIAGSPDVTIAGTAAQLYVGLWNRGDELTATDDGFLGRWRKVQRVRWA